jgi:hypothetical protein
MANSYITYTGNGATTNYTVTFPYIAQSHVKVYVDGVLKTLTTDYTWLSSTVIQFVAAPAADTIILIKRESSPTTRLVDYTQPGALNEEDLDTDSEQAFYLAQESNDTANDALGLDTTTLEYWDADSKQIKNLAEPTSDNDAVRFTDLNAAVVAAGNVPTPQNPADDGKFLRASAGSWSWITFAMSMISDATAFGKSLLSAVDAAAVRTLLGLGTSATVNTGTTNGTIPLVGASDVVAASVLPTMVGDSGAGGTKGAVPAPAAGDAAAKKYLKADGSWATSPGTILQVVNYTTGALATGTGTIAVDDTIPQNTEGDEYMTLAITPTSATSKLLIEVAWNGANSAGTASLVVALFQDSTADALAAVGQRYETTGTIQQIRLKHYMTAGTTSSTTFKVRVGCTSAGTTTFNGVSGGRRFGGVMASSITITEIAA